MQTVHLPVFKSMMFMLIAALVAVCVPAHLAHGQEGSGEAGCAERWLPGQGVPGVDGVVHAMAVLPGGDVIVGGSFSTAGSVSAYSIARYNRSTGLWSALGSGVLYVSAMAVLPGGDVIVGGSFSTAEGVPVSNIARYTPSTGVWLALGSVVEHNGSSGTVSALAVLPSGDVIVGGSFTTAGGVEANNIARYFTKLIRRIDPLDSINEAAHNTSRYALNKPADNPEQRSILRRGSKPSPGVGTADFDVILAECFDTQQQELSFEAEHMFSGVPVVLDIPFFPQTVPPGEWGCVLREPLTPPANGERTAKVRVFIPADAAVGEYTFKAVRKTLDGTRLEDKAFDHPVVILFNPWDPNDAVYMAGSSDRDEYVLNEDGAIWRGTAGSNSSIKWNYAQFDNDVFLGTLSLLDGLTETQRSSPVTTSRWLTEKIDANGGGMLVGEWCGCPSNLTVAECQLYKQQCDARLNASGLLTWQSSKPVFAKYRLTGPVQYGQCWVYAGLLTSSLRTLGIPARPVTNFESAHDSSVPPNQIIERCRVFDTATGQWRYRGESVWNFHVWCEAWMKRSDLSGRDGWQVVDATPQERSAGLYQLGPTPVTGIRASSPQAFDGAFVLSEVDSVIQKQVDNGAGCVPDGPPDSTTVGRRITTKATGTTSKVDITDQYKTPETTIDPRSFPEVQIDAPRTLPFGMPLQGIITIRNLDTQAHDFTCYILVHAIAQNDNELGIASGPRTDALSIAAGGVATVTSNVTWSQLQPVIGSTQLIEFDVVVTRVNDQKRWFKQRVAVISGLPVTVTLAPAGQVRQPNPVVATVTYSNPLAEPLAAGTLTLDSGSGLPINGVGPTEEIRTPPLAPNETITLTRTLSSVWTGERIFSASWFVPGLFPGDSMASVTVLPPCAVDFNGVGGVSVQDVFDFLTAWFANDPRADFNGVGGVTVQDIFDFLNAWFAGC